MVRDLMLKSSCSASFKKEHTDTQVPRNPSIPRGGCLPALHSDVGFTTFGLADACFADR